MNFLDKLALMGRRYEQRGSPSTGDTKLHLPEVLAMYNGKAILELTAEPLSKDSHTIRPDAERKLKVSLLDGLSEIHAPDGGWYEVFETAPTGDIAKVRIVAMSPQGAQAGELKMLVGRRTLDHYFLEDPLIASLRERGEIA
ncbi:MAG TPA: hypothetical protein VFX19_07595 [Dehalococcoidia bacterium]|jgi:hypothetical protein|nr:hypothetical protein [Dehalococcoidia bacterium]